MKIKKNDILKILAMLTMLIDHLGLMFFEEYRVFRFIGRFAFPIFAFMIAMGYTHTSSKTKYFKRLAVFAVITQIPHIFLMPNLEPNYLELNALFLFVYALGMLSVYDLLKDKIKEKNIGISILLLLTLLVILIVPELLQVLIDGFYLSYGSYGLIMVLLFYITAKKPVFMVLSYALLSVVFTYITGVRIDAYYTDSTYFESLFKFKEIWHTITTYKDGLTKLDGYFFQSRSIIAVFLIILFSSFKCNLKTNKYIFYAFYPAHIFILVLIKYLIQ